MSGDTTFVSYEDARKAHEANAKQLDIRFGGKDSVSGTGERDDWRTPPDLLRQIYTRFHLDFDPCPYPRPEGWDGLKSDWRGRAYVNPPYGTQTGKWLAKAISELEAKRIEIAVFLIHARTDTRAFHELLMPNACEIHLVRGRVAFVGPDGGGRPSPFPSMIVVLDGERHGPAPTLWAWEQRDVGQRTLEP